MSARDAFKPVTFVVKVGYEGVGTHVIIYGEDKKQLAEGYVTGPDEADLILWLVRICNG